MTRFSEQLKVDDEILHFSFNRIYNADGEKFYVVVQKDRHLVPFDMKQDENGQWKIAGSAPSWARALEERLSEMILRNN